MAAKKKRPHRKAAKKTVKKRKKKGGAAVNRPIEITIENGLVGEPQQKLKKNMGGVPDRVRWINKDPIGYTLSFGAASNGDWPFTQAPHLIQVPPADEEDGKSQTLKVNQSVDAKPYGYVSDPPLGIPPTGPDVIIE